MATVNPIQVQKFFKDMEYPASKQDVVEYAKQHGADQNVCSTLERMSDQEFETPADVSKAIGEID